MSGYRPPYTMKEEAILLNYIVQTESFNRLRGDAFWKEVEQAQILQRTWQSLKQHFKKKLIHDVHLPHYGLLPENIRKIEIAYKDSAHPRANSAAPNPSQNRPRARRANVQRNQEEEDSLPNIEFYTSSSDTD